jgi:hypothetical protein
MKRSIAAASLILTSLCAGAATAQDQSEGGAAASDDGGVATGTVAAPPSAPAVSPAPRPAPASRSRSEQRIGVAPSTPQLGDEVATSPPGTEAPAPTGLGSSAPSTSDWKPQFHGYLRVPTRVGYGPRNDEMPGSELHSPPRVPDLSYTDWRYTNNIPGPWTELLFSYGNARSSMTVSIASFNQTDSGYRDLQTQLGINQAFVTLHFPDVFGGRGGLVWTVGAFTNRYGTAGKTDAGKYQTYLFGRTHVAGETLSADIDLTPDLTLLLEDGGGAKLEAIPFTTVTPRPDYLPYPGPVPEGSTFVHHAHVGLVWRRQLQLALHHLYSYTPDDNELAGTPTQPGHMAIYGGEVRLSNPALGEGYVGYSRIDASHILSLADGIEVLHSFGGYQFKNNFFGRFDPHTGAKPPDDSGTVDTFLFQYTLSVGTMARYPARFTGNGADLTLCVFGMWNRVVSATDSHKMLKLGAEADYKALPWLAFGGRYDLVQPLMTNSSQSFSVMTGKLIFRTAFVTHETVTLQYSRYVLGSEAYPAFPYDAQSRADANVIQLVGSMWW